MLEPSVGHAQGGHSHQGLRGGEPITRPILYGLGNPTIKGEADSIGNLRGQQREDKGYP